MTELTPWLFLIAILLIVVQLCLTIIGGWLPQKIWLTASYLAGQTLVTLVQVSLVGCIGILRDWNVTTVYDDYFFVTAIVAGLLWLAGMLILHSRIPQK